MTFRMLKSQMPHNFAVAVALHASEMKAWRTHMQRVDADIKGGVDIEARHHPYPKPHAHPLVDASVNENDEADYEIVDDGPTPDMLLLEKKEFLLGEVSRAEQAAIDAVMPRGKHRLFNMRESEIRNADAAFASDIAKKNSGIVASAKNIVGMGVDVAAEVEKNRPTEDTQFLAEHADRCYRVEQIRRAAAQMHADIEDLTIKSIDQWKMTEFPK